MLFVHIDRQTRAQMVIKSAASREHAIFIISSLAPCSAICFFSTKIDDDERVRLFANFLCDSGSWL